MGIVVLDDLPYTVVFDLLDYCITNHCDEERARTIIDACYVFPIPDDIVWELNIPDEHLTWLLLKHKLYE